MIAAVQAVEARFEALTARHLQEVLRIEQLTHAHPWSHASFTDSLTAGHEAQVLLAGDALLGYFVAMKGVDEVHLLNITVAPEFQQQGWARVMLDAVTIWAKGQSAAWLWLEVRVSNQRAIKVYEDRGFRRVGRRKSYYSAPGGQREDALVLGLPLGQCSDEA